MYLWCISDLCLDGFGPTSIINLDMDLYGFVLVSIVLFDTYNNWVCAMVLMGIS